MNTLIEFLDLRNDIHDVFYLLEDEASELLLKKICSKPEIKRLSLASKNKKMLYRMKQVLTEECRSQSYHLPEIELIQYTRKVPMEKITGTYDTILFDCKSDLQAIMSIKELRPNYLIGKIWKDRVPYFELWETFRNKSQHIYLKCIRDNNKEEILNWNRDPNNDIELSVIFPVYNVAKYLRQCLDSVTAWKAPYIEFLFVNDGSPDNSKDIILEYHEKDSRVKLIDKPNGGCASARKKGLEVATGRYIGFIDPDDFVDKKMFEKLLSRALLGSYDICYSGYNAYYENSQKIEHIDDTIRKPYSNGITDPIMIKQLIMFCRVAIWRGIYRHDFLSANKITFNESFRRFDDLPFKVEVFARAKSVVTIPEYLYYYRLERPGQDMACNDDRLYVHFDIFNYLNKKMHRMKDQRLYDCLQICKVQTHCFALQKIQRKFAKEYAQKARDDFKTNHMTIRRTILLIAKYIGIKNAIPYLAIMLNIVSPYLKMFDYRRAHKDRKYELRQEKTAKKLYELSR